MRSGDRYRLAVTAERACQIYSFKVDDAGEIAHLPDAARSTPEALTPGRSHLIDWMPLEGSGSVELLFVALPKRSAELQRLYQRYRQASAQRRVDLRDRLAEKLDELAAARITVPLASD